MRGRFIPGTADIYSEYNMNRFWSKVDLRANVELCWEWKEAANKGGYGKFKFNKTSIISSRAAYQIFNKTNPGELCVLHKCDNRRCCNPYHLFLGTRRDNNVDMVNKGRNKSFYGANHPMARLTEQDISDIKILRQSGVRYAAIGRAYGVTGENISGICRNKHWKHLNK